ncbi:2-hydroxychromene-2-carboxylate isomerase [Pleionea sp. CnH1-48]|uniref:2-hydroxychromene-2-carboxylate isomerase n=1 Tax=Pleionea sp. CnH1-48 TaxID=2954494 RepID=UPI002097BA0E|nr:2-hydroxychromene-2-carboxylate isomerase [Pleionea sp. CnH1-48]MCO7227153.1 2-hydroxychromene-2-carboxylate isomerase [Pleionea sp. CnH1-48]
MKKIQWYFDFLSPFAYFQLQQFNQLPADVEVEFKPTLLAGLLKHWQQKGPAEIPPKREFTYRYIHWLAKQQNIPFKMPPEHPFHPLKTLRLAIACRSSYQSVHAIFDYLWNAGYSQDDATQWELLCRKLDVTDWQQAVASDNVKQELRSNTDEAIARQVFGVPTFVCDEKIFWGFDAFPMLLDYLQNGDMFDDEENARLEQLPEGVQRKID